MLPSPPQGAADRIHVLSRGGSCAHIRRSRWECNPHRGAGYRTNPPKSQRCRCVRTDPDTRRLASEGHFIVSGSPPGPESQSRIPCPPGSGEFHRVFAVMETVGNRQRASTGCCCTEAAYGRPGSPRDGIPFLRAPRFRQIDSDWAAAGESTNKEPARRVAHRYSAPRTWLPANERDPPSWPVGTIRPLVENRRIRERRSIP